MTQEPAATDPSTAGDSPIVDEPGTRLPSPPSAVISWAHQNVGWSPDQTERWSETIRALAELLTASYVRVEVDLWYQHDSTTDWTRFGPQMIQECDFVIIAVSTAWRERWEGTNKPTQGAGAAAEADTIKGLFERDQSAFQRKMLIAVLPGASDDDVPPTLARLNRFYIKAITQEGISELLRTVHKQPKYVRPALGAMPDLSPAPSALTTRLNDTLSAPTPAAARQPEHSGPQGAVTVTGTGNVVTVGDHHIANTYVGAGPQTPLEVLGRGTYLERIGAASQARFDQRRFGAGLTAGQVERLRGAPVRIPGKLQDLRAGHYRVLVGPLGSGKSDIAETWFGECIARARADASAPTPIWIAAKELDTALEARVVGEVGLTALSVEGVCLVVDGLDERSEQSANVLRQSAEFVAQWPTSQVLLTSRSRVGINDQCEVAVPPLSKADARRLVVTVAGRRPGVLGHHIDNAITRPFFALLVGRHLDAAEGTTGIPELIDRVVEAAVTAEGYDLYADLRRLAVETIRQGKPVDPARFAAADVAAQIRRSSLTTVSGGSACAFSLAIFEQWFAAKAILEGDTRLEELTTSLQTFDRWKYVLAMVLAAGEPTRVDPVMAALARWNPGAASWVIRETRSGNLSRARPDFGPDDWKEIGTRLRTATEAWLEGLGPLSSAFDPYSWIGSQDFDAVTVAVELSASRLDVTWLPSGRDTDHSLPPVIRGSDVRRDRPTVQRGHMIPTGLNWVWEVARDHLASDVSDRFLTIADRIGRQHPGVMQNEMGSIVGVDLDGVRSLIEALSSTSAPRDAGSGSADLAAAISSLRELAPGVDRQEPLYPAPDAPLGPGGAAEFQPDTMLERVRKVIAAAMTCYLELCDLITPNFGDTLGRRGLMPVDFYGNVFYGHRLESDDFALFMPHEPGISWLLKPIGNPNSEHRLRTANTVSLTLNDEARAAEVTDGEDVLYRQFRDYVEAYPAYEPFAGKFTRTSGSLRVLGKGPATRIALSWLWGDLRELGWVSGHIPYRW